MKKLSYTLRASKIPRTFIKKEKIPGEKNILSSFDPSLKMIGLGHTPPHHNNTNLNGTF